MTDHLAPSRIRADAHRLVPRPTWDERATNDDVDLVVTLASCDAVVEYDFEGVEVGSAEYRSGPTGVTVVAVPAGARMAIDARGGAIGLSSGYEYRAHAIALAGGSVYGLSAGSGVADELRARNDHQGSIDELRLVSTAVIYDFGARETAVHPDAALGRAAMVAAVHGRVPVGRVGAGATASAGKFEVSRIEYTGQGAGFRQAGDAKVLVVTVVNPVGVIVDRDGTVVRGNYDLQTGRRTRLEDDYIAALDAGAAGGVVRGNTTITAVVTNVRLTDLELTHFARQVHSSMNRAIQPFHTLFDGDTLFALTTDEVDLGVSSDGEPLSAIAAGALASEAAWDAVLSAAR